MKNLHRLPVYIQNTYNGPIHYYTEQTLANTLEEARSNIWERYRHAYNVRIEG